jgi:CubicO group peptidase (beta-lactamase class C family)
VTDPRVQDALDHALELGEVGVQVAAYLGDELVVDAWTGVADPETERTVDGDTLFSVFSVTKAVTATALHIQAERGLVDYTAPIARYWPEFAENGKHGITVRQALTHRSGVPQMPEGVTPERMGDWDWMISRIEAFAPLYEPGSTNAYQKFVFGWIIAEIVRRTDPKSRPFAQFVQEEISSPLQINDLYLGVPEAELDRVAPVISASPPQPHPDPVSESTMPVAVAPGPVFNRPDVRQAVGPGAGGVMTARAGARFFALLANRGEFNGRRLLSEERLLSFTVPRERGLDVDPVLGWSALVGQGGYWLGGASPPAYPVVGSSTQTLCHPGAGGSIGWADLDTRLAVAIFHNQMHPDRVRSTDPDVNPFIRLADAVRAVAADRQLEHQGGAVV